MKLITNNTPNKHVDILNKLIPLSKKIILCTGWIDNAGINKILPHLVKAANSNTEITIYSNKKHTQDDVKNTISKHDNITHIIVSQHKKYLHSKIYYFEHEKTFTAIIGSANLTSGGLKKNEELSIELNGNIGSLEHTNIIIYLNELDKYR